MEKFLAKVAEINGSVNGVVWGIFGLALLIGTGVIVTLSTKAFQVSHIGLWWKNTIGSLFTKNVMKHRKEKGVISPFQALCTALAATVGTGNIAGVAAAIAVGGAGAVFWMWVAAFFGMMTNYAENVLGIYFRRKNSEGEWSGGAMYYLQDGMGSYSYKDKHGEASLKKPGRILAVLFCIFTMLASFGIGSMGQVNKIVANVASVFNAKTGVIAEGFTDATLVGGAFNQVFSWGNIGSRFVAIAMFLFAFTTVLGWSHYGSKAWEYLFGAKTTFIFRIIHVITVIFGAVLTSSLAWDISDTFNGLMMIPNLIGVLFMIPLVVKITKNYINRKVKKSEEKPILSYDPDIQAEAEKGLEEE